MARVHALTPIGGSPGSGKVVGPKGSHGYGKVIGAGGELVLEVRFLADDRIIIRVYKEGQLAILSSFTGKNNDYSNLTIKMLP